VPSSRAHVAHAAWVAFAAAPLVPAWQAGCAHSGAEGAGGPAAEPEPDDPGPAGDADAVSVLAFTRTTGYRHASIDPAVRALRAVASERGWRFEHTEDPARFSDGGLAAADVIVFLLTTGDVLDGAQQAALERWLHAGGGWVGVHSASDTEYDWPWYGRLVGAYFAAHPRIQSATVRVARPGHSATAHLPAVWQREDEWYDFRTNPRQEVDVLLTVDEATYDGGGMGADHPIAWSRAFEGGRSIYTALGHTEASWSEPAFLDHIAGAIAWAAASSRLPRHVSD